MKPSRGRKRKRALSTPEVLLDYFGVGEESDFQHEIILKTHPTIPQLQAVRERSPSRHKLLRCVCWLQILHSDHDNNVSNWATFTAVKTTTWEPFHMQSGKWMEECSTVSYTTLRYRPELESRSSALRGAALQKEWQPHSNLQPVPATGRNTSSWWWQPLMWPQHPMQTIHNAASHRCTSIFYLDVKNIAHWVKTEKTEK